MTTEQRKKFSAHIQRLLKVRRVSFPIANTEKGPLSLTYTKDAQDFEIILDAVPLNMNDYDNRELKAMAEKYLFEKESDGFDGHIVSVDQSVDIKMENVFAADLIPEAPKKRGRPAKNDGKKAN